MPALTAIQKIAYATSTIVQAGYQQPMAVFAASFKTSEGDPFPVNVIISDGFWRKEFNNVTQVKTEVPCNATYTIITPKDIIRTRFCFRPGDVKNFLFFFYPHNLIELYSKAYIVYEEVGANTTLMEHFNPANNSLDVTIQKAWGKIVGIEVAFDDLRKNRRSAVTHRGFALPSALDSACEELSMYWKVECQLRPNSSKSHLKFSFTQLDQSMGTIRLGHVLYNDAIICYPQNDTILRNLETGKVYHPSFTDPCYAVSAGNYILTIRLNTKGSPICIDQSFPNRIDIPVRVWRGRGELLFNIYLPMITETAPFTFHVFAESPFAKSTYLNLHHDASNKSLSVDVTTNINRCWWAYYVLPIECEVKYLLAYDDADNMFRLYEGINYTINAINRYKFVVIRIDPSIRKLKLQYDYEYATIIEHLETRIQELENTVYWLYRMVIIMGAAITIAMISMALKMRKLTSS